MATIDRQAAYSGVKDVAPQLAFDQAALERYLLAHARGFAGPLAIKQFKGGQSNPTYFLETPSRNYVLRRKPPGKLLASAHAVDREFKVISALHAQGFPVPEPIVLCDDESIIGTAFYVMSHVAGRIFWSPAIPESDPAERAAIFDQMNATLALLHSYDPGAIGLADYGKAEGYVARQIARWSKQYVASRTDDVPDMERLMRWLPEHAPQTLRPAIVHGDYRLDNMILHANEPRVLAVLDWELSTVGDAIADFTYHAMTWVMPRAETGMSMPTLQGLDLVALGIPDLDSYCDLYARRAGLAEIPHRNFYFAYNLFRLAAILQGILGRVRDGTAANANAANMANSVAPLAAAAVAFAEKAGA
ncbi:phosphotransferase family protein [Terrarubrum flagellatum]|uniref:phosphotransferase family protein n=1 Tax=Terrirubrum flagellatum TaxID=2895980 RepID=UPI003144F061